MLLILIVCLLCFIVLCNGRVLLYNTINIKTSSEKFDCVYVRDPVELDRGGNHAGKVPYCRRPDIGDDFIKVTNNCENGGQLKYFVTLLEKNVQPFEVLEWTSNIEIADEYAVFYYNNDSMIKPNEIEHFLCHCTRSGTFDKYCQYQLTHGANSFEASQISQVNIRSNYPSYHQQFGSIVCYKTLSCNSGLLCLDWRDICNHEQQCENGWDEENCDRLEFNECEEDEYRCTNGMCISEEYWLDGK